jgi:DNA-binding transcriptional LysR family regulator
MFDFRLQVFYTVARRLSFTKAAEELYITQPAVTRHIHELESHFKLKLFERNGNKILLTPAGKTLLHHTESLFSVHRNIEFDMNDLAREHRGKLRLGASTTVAQYVLPRILASFRQKYPDVSVVLTSGNTEQIEKALLGSEIDVGVIEGHPRNKSIQYIPFLKDEIVLVANINHPLVRKELKPDDLRTIPLLMREPGSGTLEVIAHALKGVGLKLSQLAIEMQLDSTESIKSYLLHSPCMAFLSVHAIAKELQHNEFRVIAVKGLTIERPFYLIRTHGESSSLPELFIRFSNQYNLK